jgi:glycosyltransferase involved in cell wall biosynthesis
VQRQRSRAVEASTPWVTVAVPSFNQGRFLEATLRSIFAQRVPIEVMLADGGSTDDTLQVIARWQDRFTWWRSAPDGGQPASINEAIARGRAPYICWMNSDDLFLPGGLAALALALESHPDAAVAYGRCRLIDEDGHLIGLLRGEAVSQRSLSRHQVIPQPASLIRREAWNKVGGLKENLHFSHDYELWWRLYRSGSNFAQIDIEVAAARFHPNAKSFARAREMYAEAKSVVLAHNGSLPICWHFKEPFSIGARQEGSVLQSLARAYRLWSMRPGKAAKVGNEECNAPAFQLRHRAEL